MQIDIGPYIGELLYEHNTVNIPGLGSFVAGYKPAIVDQVEGVLHPPSKELKFNKNLVANDGILLQYVAEKHKLSTAEAEKALKQYLTTIKDAIERREIVVFPNVGRLYKDYENKLQFLADNTNFNTDSYGLPSLQYSPMARSERPATLVQPGPTITQAPLVTPVASEPDLRTWIMRNLPWLAAVVVIVIAFSIWWIAAERADRLTESQKPPVPDDRVNISPSSREGEEGAADSYREDDDLIAEEEMPASPEPERDTEEPTRAPGQKSAIIVIGHFGDAKNVQSLLEKIYEEGFEPYTAKRGNLTRVGVQLAYDDEQEVQVALRAIRQKFEPKAKILEE